MSIYSEVVAENGEIADVADLERKMWDKITSGVTKSSNKIPWALVKKIKVQLPYLPDIVSYSSGCQALKKADGLYVPCGAKCSGEGLMLTTLCQPCTKTGAKYGQLEDRGLPGTYTDPEDKHEITYGTWLAKKEKTIEEVCSAIAEAGFEFTIPANYLAVNAKRVETKRRPGRPGAKKDVSESDDESDSSSSSEKPKAAPKKVKSDDEKPKKAKATKAKKAETDSDSDEPKAPKKAKAPKAKKAESGSDSETKKTKAKKADSDSEADEPKVKKTKAKKAEKADSESESEEPKAPKKTKAPKAKKAESGSETDEPKAEKKTKAPKAKKAESGSETDEPKATKKAKAPNAKKEPEPEEGQLSEEVFEAESDEVIEIDGEKFKLRNEKMVFNLEGEWVGNIEDGEVVWRDGA